MSNEFQLGGIVPWGRTADEYEAFFALADVRESARVLDCGGGPSSFAAEWAMRGRWVVSCDPLHRLPSAEISANFTDTSVRMLQGMRAASTRFNWSFYGDPESVVERRREALARFLDDRGSADGSSRYVAAACPNLPFASNAFDLVLCSHLLFLYSEELDLEAHVAAVYEMIRVAQEVRIFPLVELGGATSRHLQAVMRALDGVHCKLVDVPFEFQLGATVMLQVRRL